MESSGELAWRVVELYLGGAALPPEEKARLRDVLRGRRQPREKTLEAIRAFLSARGIE